MVRHERMVWTVVNEKCMYSQRDETGDTPAGFDDITRIYRLTLFFS
jgi:hypothetical protein